MAEARRQTENWAATLDPATVPHYAAIATVLVGRHPAVLGDFPLNATIDHDD